MSNVVRSFVVAFALAFSSSGRDVLSAPPEGAPSKEHIADELKLILGSEKMIFKGDDPIWLVLTTENISKNRQRVVRYTVPASSYWVEVTDENGREVGARKFSRRDESDGISLPGNSSRMLDPTEKIVEKQDLRSIMELPERGSFRVRAWRFPLIFYRVNLQSLARARKPLVFTGGIESNEISIEIR